MTPEEYNNLAPDQQRVMDESEELFMRIVKLAFFMDSSQFDEIPPEEQNLLQQQAEYMWSYFGVLITRMDRFMKN